MAVSTTNPSQVKVIYEVMNEVYTAMGGGILGMAVLIKHGLRSNQVLRTLTLASVTAGCLLYVYRSSEKKKASKNKIVLITGCDSGLGYSLACHTADLGFTVIAGFLNLKSKGARDIKELYDQEIKQIELNISSTNSVNLCLQYVRQYLRANSDCELYAVINNAGVMVFGEFEWQTEKLINHQLEINLFGTMKVTRAFCPLLRQYGGRIVTVTSHCAKATLPGLAVYGATKAGLAGWCDALRVEMKKYGVNVIQFIPGSFTTQSNILSNQAQHVYEMHENFTPEQHDFYSEYFKRYNTYLSYISKPVGPLKIENVKLYNVYENVLLDATPKAVYVNEPFRYFFYHLLFKISPVRLRDYFVTKFMMMPEYKKEYTSVEVIG